MWPRWRPSSPKAFPRTPLHVREGRHVVFFAEEVHPVGQAVEGEGAASFLAPQCGRRGVSGPPPSGRHYRVDHLDGLDGVPVGLTPAPQAPPLHLVERGTGGEARPEGVRGKLSPPTPGRPEHRGGLPALTGLGALVRPPPYILGRGATLCFLRRKSVPSAKPSRVRGRGRPLSPPTRVMAVTHGSCGRARRPRHAASIDLEVVR